MLANEPPMPHPISTAWNTTARFDDYQTRGQREFSSVRGLPAVRYDLIARDGSAERARTMLGPAGLLPAAP
jgi:hypothetical protein